MEAIYFFIVREDLVQPTLSMLFTFVSMSALESLEFWLEGELDYLQSTDIESSIPVLQFSSPTRGWLPQ